MIDPQRSKKYMNLDHSIGVVMLVVISLYFLYYIIPANADLSDGRYALYMDELISFDGVQKILHPGNFSAFMENVLDGNDHRYGRILWNSSALFSFVPEYLWGEKGRIIATRMLHALVLMSSYFILAFTFTRTWIIRALLFLALMSIPTTAYYSVMPKPEPLQLLFISIFLFIARKNEFRLGPYWFFMGMAFGSKISALLLILYFGFIAFVQDRYIFSTRSYLKKIAATTAFTIMGFLMAEPMFLRSFNHRSIKRYLASTFFNTGHGSDDVTVNWLSWLNYIFEKYTNVPINWSIVALILVSLLLMVLIVFKIQHDRSIKLDDKHADNISIVIFVAGLALILPILFKVHRLWPFYLHNGAVLLLTGLFSCSEFSVLNEFEGKSVLPRVALPLSFAIIIMITASAILYLVPQSINLLKASASRTKTEGHIAKLSEYNDITNFLDSLHKRIGRRLQVYYDPNLYLASSNEKYKIVRFWGPFLSWDKAFEVIVYYDEHIMKKLPQKTSALYESSVTARELYAQYVCRDEKANDGSELCYIPLQSENESVRIFLRNDLMSTSVLQSGGS